jgi:hypothetical protein
MSKNKNQGQPDPGSRSGQSQDKNQNQNLEQSGQNRAQQPEDSKQSGEQSGEWQRPLTNQDEQRKPTNAGSSDAPMGEEETEGDPGQERIKPYKNIGDDSEETEKKTPSMGK